MDILKTTSEIKIGDTTYKIPKLTLADFAELDDWARRRIMNRLPIQDFSAKAMSEIAKIKIGEESIMNEISSMSGVKESLRIVLKKQKLDPDKILNEITIDDLPNIAKALVGNAGDEPKNQSGPEASQ